MDIGQRGPYKDASPKIDFRSGFAKLRLRREQSGLARFAEPKQLKAIEDGLTLGGFGGEGLYLSYYPLLTKAVAEGKTLPLPTQKLILEVALPRSAD